MARGLSSMHVRITYVGVFFPWREFSSAWPALSIQAILWARHLRSCGLHLSSRATEARRVKYESLPTRRTCEAKSFAVVDAAPRCLMHDPSLAANQEWIARSLSCIPAAKPETFEGSHQLDVRPPSRSSPFCSPPTTSRLITATPNLSLTHHRTGHVASQTLRMSRPLPSPSS